MEARRETRMGRMKYYHVHWPRQERFFRPGPKILAVRKCARPTFSYTEKEAYVMMAFNVIRSERVSMKYLAALFNSRLMQFWFLRRGKMQGDFSRWIPPLSSGLPSGSPVCPCCGKWKGWRTLSRSAIARKGMSG